MRNFLTEHYFPEAKKIKKAENLNFSKQKIKSIKEWILTYKDALTYNLGEADRIADSMRKYDLCDSVEDCVCFIKNNYIRRQGFSGDLISSVQNACNEALKKISDQFINHFSLHATSMRLKRVRQVEENKIIEELSPEIAVEAGVYSSQNLGRLSLLFVRLKTVGLMIFNFLACLFLACFGFVVIFTVVLFGAGIVLLLQVLHLIPIAGTAVAIGAIAIFFALAGEAVKEISGFFNEQIEKIKNEEKLALKNSLENEVSRLFDDQRITLEANKNAQIEIMRRSLDKTMEAYMGSGINKHPLMMKTIDGDVAFLDGISAQMKGDDGSLADDPTKQAVSSREEIGHTISPCGRCGQKLRFLSGEGSLIIGCPRCKNKFIYRANGDVGSGGTASDERA